MSTMEPDKYESIRTGDSKNIFETTFGSEPFRMLMYMDYGYSQKQQSNNSKDTDINSASGEHKDNGNSKKDPSNNLEDIDINKINGTFEKWKYTLIFFFRNVDEIFKPAYPDYESNNNLDSYSVFLENKILLEHFLVRETAPNLSKQMPLNHEKGSTNECIM